MPVPPTPREHARQLPASWGPLVDGDRALPVDRAAMLVAARLRISIDDAADMLNALPNRHRYLLLELIGETGRSVVYAGVDRMLVREVGIKLHREQDERANRRVMAEVRTMSEVEHPNIVRVFDIGEQDGFLYSVTELCDEDLHSWCPARGWSEIVQRIVEAGCGLAAVHAAGFVHGDIKPTNILIKGGVAKLADFGLVGRPGLARGVVGTPGFIAPEVAAGHRRASGDVFALAASAWACLFHGLPFGTPPSHGALEAAIFVAVERAAGGEFATPKRMPPGMPMVLLEVVRRGMRPDPRERPSLSEWLDELHTVRTGTERIRRLGRSLPVAGGIALVVGLLGFGAYRGVMSGRDAPGRGEDNTSVDVSDVDRSVSPCDEALRAAQAGNAGAVIAALNTGLTEFDTYPQAEKLRLAEAATTIAEQLEATGLGDQAQVVWTFATLFWDRAGQEQEAARALHNGLQSRESQPNPAAPPQSK